MATEEENLLELNQDRNFPEKTTLKTDAKPGPNIVIYMLLGAVAIPSDLLKLIPILGTILALPFSLILWLWRGMSSRFKQSPVQKIAINGIFSGIPFTNTAFVVSCFAEETKLGKTIFNKSSKLAKFVK
jgi:hypothetical protein